MTKISDGITDTLADLEEDNRRLRAENERLRLAGNELADVVGRNFALINGHRVLAEWRKATR